MYTIDGNYIRRGNSPLIETTPPNSHSDIIKFSQPFQGNTLETIEDVVEHYKKFFKRIDQYGINEKVLLGITTDSFLDHMFKLHEDLPFAWLGELIRVKTGRIDASKVHKQEA